MTGPGLRLIAARALVEPPAGAGAGADVAPAAGPPRGVAAALAHRLATDPARPLLTFYDDATGERVEFSATTFDNWVAKTANMLVDSLGLVPGDRVGVDLPTHWLSSVILLAAWSAGMEVVLVQRPGTQAGAAEAGAAEAGAAEAGAAEAGAAGTGAAGTGAAGTGAAEPEPPAPEPLGALFVAEDRLDSVAALAVDETVALSLRPLGGRMRYPIPGVLDYSAEVPGHGDRFVAPPPPAEQAGLLAVAAATARAWRLGPADRVLCVAPPDTAAGLVGALLAPLVAGASIVLCRRFDAGVLPRRVEMEKITAVDASTLTADSIPLPPGVRPLPAAPAGSRPD